VSGFLPAYRRTGSPLHAARAGVAAAYVMAICALVLIYDHPLVLGATLVAVIAAGRAAGVGAELARAARLALPLVVLVALINPLVSQEGLTVLVQGWTVPVLGRLDITLEALAYGALTGLRVLVLVLAFGLYSATVNPDDVLRLFGSLSMRSSLTATLATRLVPVLGRDAQRLADAYELRAERPAAAGGSGRRLRRGAILTRALAAGALERAVDLAAAMEVRGFAAARGRRRARVRTAWSVHDVAFFGAALTLALVALAGVLGGVARFDPYPTLQADFDLATRVFALSTVGLALLPFWISARWRARIARLDSGPLAGRVLRPGSSRA
jgi:energy-coupling factor transport system permease protein